MPAVSSAVANWDGSTVMKTEVRLSRNETSRDSCSEPATNTKLRKLVIMNTAPTSPAKPRAFSVPGAASPAHASMISAPMMGNQAQTARFIRLRCQGRR